MTEIKQPPDPVPLSLTIGMRQSEDLEIQFMIAMDNLLSVFATRLNDDDAIERVVNHIAEKWGCHRLPQEFLK
jgi:hypothetical protein